MKNGKRILSVTIKHVSDNDADVSDLGTYASKPAGEYTIHRTHERECNLNSDVTASRDMLERVINRIEETRLLDDEDSPEDILKQEAIALCVDEQGNLEECNCDGVGIDSRSFEYFNTSGNYDGGELKDTIEYTWQDYKRAEEYGQYWWYLGVVAEAEIAVSVGGKQYEKKLTQSVWSVESDCTPADFKEFEDDQLAELRHELKEHGFSSRAISTAFKNVRVDE